MLKSILSSALTFAVNSAIQKGLMIAVSLPDNVIERPQDDKHGDYASSIALKLARATRSNPMVIARQLVNLLPKLTEVSGIEVAPPGFINFTISKEWLADQVDSILREGDNYGNSNFGRGESVQVEFVSVNPTGPLHVGHGRGAVLGSVLANALSAAGFRVQREYYVNDAGTQIDNFRRTLLVRYLQQLGRDISMPEEGYFGQYMIDLAKEIVTEKGSCYANLDEGAALRELGDLGLAKMLAVIRSELTRLGVNFDEWFSERTLYVTGVYESAMDILRKGGYISEKENAVWFTSTSLGEDKDNVLVRTSGTPTYFASDVAYHYNKLVLRNFSRVIDIWGADHQGHVSRMKAVLSALGLDPARLTVLITQLVTLRRGTELVKLSKRSGDMITMQDVMDEVGVDACRFVFLSRSADSQMDFDLELVKKQSMDNPVYYVQYAYARLNSIVKLAREQGIDDQSGDVRFLKEPEELALLREMLILPEVLELVASTLQPHHLPHYAQNLATVFHSFYQHCRVITPDVDLSRARLKLVRSALLVFRRTLNLMGMSAPEHM
jgi:arginyl-tRNA synthetase